MTVAASRSVTGTERRRVRVRGVVQGVGFRPFVYALASRLSLTGEVGNDADGVLTEVQGAAEDVERFCRALAEEAPPLAVVESVTWQVVAPRAGSGFSIVASGAPAAGTGRRTLVPPDVATCADCLAECADPSDRRHRHPFITCTACGPRFTIVTGLPYDRPMTTMARFPLCPDCAREYADPADRRFHAQPVSCHVCGPVLEFVEPGAPALAREPALQAARRLLAAGGIVAVKGIGGYHLACDATDPVALARLRDRKRRGDKPFAVLVADLAAARRIADLDDDEAALLVSARRPIVLLPRHRTPTGPAVADQVAPGSDRLGLMLPPTALHHLLLGLPGDPPGPQALVLTSGNLAGEPIVTGDPEALQRLGGIADAWLRHDRPIHVPCDDSVLAVVDGAELPIRRSRGYAPMPVALPVEVEPSLAVGGDLKNTFCVAQGRYAWLSGHVGDMDDLVTQQAFDGAVAHLQGLVEVAPRRLVADAHPGYRSAAWARRRAVRDGLDAPVAVQHHHAHIASVLAEHGQDGATAVLGIAFDGTGYGDDGAVWGGEVLLADYDGYRRIAHLDYVPLAGGDASVRRPYRMALAHLRRAGIAWDDDLAPVAACPAQERVVLARQLDVGLASVPTSSMGRLFDAVASIAGVCQQAGYEAQAAMELQALAERAERAERAEPSGPGPGSSSDPAYTLPLLTGGQGPWRWDGAALIRQIVADLRSGCPQPVVALRFHRAVAGAVADVAAAAAAHGTWADPGRRVALSGGVFANGLLLSLTVKALRHNGYTVLRHRLVPPNDGGLALGQIVVGARARR
jgi:hydrogenase maturation protein HypF